MWCIIFIAKRVLPVVKNLRCDNFTTAAGTQEPVLRRLQAFLTRFLCREFRLMLLHTSHEGRQFHTLISHLQLLRQLHFLQSLLMFTKSALACTQISQAFLISSLSSKSVSKITFNGLSLQKALTVSISFFTNS